MQRAISVVLWRTNYTTGELSHSERRRQNMSQELGTVPGEHFLNDTWSVYSVLCGNAETLSHKGRFSSGLGSWSPGTMTTDRVRLASNQEMSCLFLTFLQIKVELRITRGHSGRYCVTLAPKNYNM